MWSEGQANILKHRPGSANFDPIRPASPKFCARPLGQLGPKYRGPESGRSRPTLSRSRPDIFHGFGPTSPEIDPCVGQTWPGIIQLKSARSGQLRPDFGRIVAGRSRELAHSKARLHAPPIRRLSTGEGSLCGSRGEARGPQQGQLGLVPTNSVRRSFRPTSSPLVVHVLFFS